MRRSLRQWAWIVCWLQKGINPKSGWSNVSASSLPKVLLKFCRFFDTCNKKVVQNDASRQRYDLFCYLVWINSVQTLLGAQVPNTVLSEKLAGAMTVSFKSVKQALCTCFESEILHSPPLSLGA